MQYGAIKDILGTGVIGFKRGETSEVMAKQISICFS
jgi:hypothetical protein